MKNSKTIIFLVGMLLWSFFGFSQKKMTRDQYISTYKDIAIRNMREHKVPASITLAQGVLESGDGNSELAQKSNNHFGIKYHIDWTGKKTYHDDDKKQECFRVYKTVYDSYADHANFLHKSRYAKCFELDITDYKGWAKELKKAGYATNPKYPDLLIKIIEDHKLYAIDQEAISGKGEETKPDLNKKYDANSEFADIAYDDKPMVKVSENNIKFVEATRGDTPLSLAEKLTMGSWQIRTYNDVSADYIFSEGEKVYVQPKRNKGTQDFHLTKPNETLWTISQQYGVKLKKLAKYNQMKTSDRPRPGQKVYLHKQ